jgi:hypothetical protein
MAVAADELSTASSIRMMRPSDLRTSVMARDEKDRSMKCRNLAGAAVGALALALSAVPAAAAGVTTYTFTGQALRGHRQHQHVW